MRVILLTAEVCLHLDKSSICGLSFTQKKHVAESTRDAVDHLCVVHPSTNTLTLSDLFTHVDHGSPCF